MSDRESRRVMALGDIWLIEDADQFVGALREYLYEKKSGRNLPLSVWEQNACDICDLYGEICIDGFNTLFYQVFFLADCHRVEAVIREMGLPKLADWFAEARLIYCRHRTDLTEADYDALDPFEMEEAEGQRFDEIGELFIGQGSELFQIAEPIKAYALRNRGEFS